MPSPPQPPFPLQHDKIALYYLATIIPTCPRSRSATTFPYKLRMSQLRCAGSDSTPVRPRFSTTSAQRGWTNLHHGLSCKGAHLIWPTAQAMSLICVMPSSVNVEESLFNAIVLAIICKDVNQPNIRYNSTLSTHPSSKADPFQ
jgi:hypothetical protein